MLLVQKNHPTGVTLSLRAKMRFCNIVIVDLRIDMNMY